MKKYNYIILFVLILITISISSYFFYLDIMYKDKLVRKDVNSLYDLKKAAGRPLVVYANQEQLTYKADDYNQMIIELNLDAIATVEGNGIQINGQIHNGFSYLLLKRLLDIIKNDEVNLLSTCLGRECTDNDYGFLIKFRPYTLQLK